MNNNIPEKEEPSAVENAIDRVGDIMVGGMVQIGKLLELFESTKGRILLLGLVLAGGVVAYDKYNSPEQIDRRLERSRIETQRILEAKKKEETTIGAIKEQLCVTGKKCEFQVQKKGEKYQVNVTYVINGKTIVDNMLCDPNKRNLEGGIDCR